MRACGLRGAYSGTIHYIGTIHCATHHLRDSGVLGRYSGKSTVPDFLSPVYCTFCLFVVPIRTPFALCPGTVELRANLPYWTRRLLYRSIARYRIR